ncbi:MAG: S8 family serine peptidase, partial [Owenweeksia sp.]
GWGNVTGGHKIAKNVVAVANLSRLDVLAGSSSRGPASDGRIKPDVAAVGSSVFSTTNPNSYTLKSGTSMAAPGVAGTVAVLYEAYRDNNSGNDPESGLLKAILMNSSDDLGNAGPDYRYGYGRVNARRAHKIIQNKTYVVDSVGDGGSKTFQLNIPANTAEARIMLYWSDVPASTLAARALVNDLDLEVVYGGATLQPWVLDPTPVASNLNALAVPARDSLNNTEQVTINNPTSGTVTINVSGFDIPSANQKFYVVYEFVPDEIVLTYPLGGEGFVPGETEYIRWDAPSGIGSFTLEYSGDGGTSWQVVSSNIAANRRYHAWTVPNEVSGNYRMRISRNGKLSVSPGLFSVIKVPTNLDVARSCPDSLLLTWDTVANATGYVVYRLGARYMDSIGTTTNSFFNILSNNPSAEDWFSVAALANGNSVGRRAIAIQKAQGVFNCALLNDVAVSEVVSPAAGAIPDCYSYTNIPVTVRLYNNGANPISNFPVSYSFDNGPLVTSTISATIAPGAFLNYTFPGSSVSITSSHTIQIYSSATVDDNAYNDTLTRGIQLYSATTVGFPYSQNFETFSNCGTSSNCDQTNCNLSSGWFNPSNGVSDDIDWRTNNGSTPSNQTGPSVDHNPGSGIGRYLYLEASGDCDSNEAILMSPCIDLSGANSPLLDFWYHMFGANMGTLNVDIFDGSEWYYNVIPTISGNQGTA